MQKLINKNGPLDDRWTLLKEATDPDVLEVIPGKNLIVPLKFWKANKAELENYSGEVAVWLDSNELASEIGANLKYLPLVALNFPVFSDGRSYTNARVLRETLGYKGEIRAIGDVLRDQLYYMDQCGFDTFSLRHDQDEATCHSAFSDFHTGYQATVSNPVPLFRRRQ